MENKDVTHSQGERILSETTIELLTSHGFGKANPTTDGHKSSIRKYVQYLSQTFIIYVMTFGLASLFAVFLGKKKSNRRIVFAD